MDYLKSATNPFNVLLASTRTLVTEFADNLNRKPKTSPYPTMRLEAIHCIILSCCRRYPKSLWNTSAYALLQVYIFSTCRLDVMIHLAGTETNLKTNAFMRLVALSPNPFTSSLWIMALYKLRISAVRRRNTVFSAMKDLDNSNLSHPNPLFISSKIRSFPPLRL